MSGGKSWGTPQTSRTVPEDEEIVWTTRLGAHLQASRKSAGLRRVDLAGQLGVSEETIRLWEKGAVQPSADRLARLIALLSLETAQWAAETPHAPELPPLARRLRSEREARGITQAGVVRILGVPQATYAGWETGRSTPGTSLFQRLAAFLGIPERDVETLCASPFVVDFATWPPFGQFVGARRQELRLTRAALADVLGVAQSTVVSWELGYRVPAAEQLTRLADALSVGTGSLAAALPRRLSPTSLGDLIRSRQRELGLRAADVADLVGTTEATMSRWVNGHSRPGPRNLKRLAEALRMPHAQILEAAGGAA